MAAKPKRGRTKGGRDRIHTQPPEPPPAPPPPPPTPPGSSARIKRVDRLTDEFERQLCELLERGTWVQVAVAELGLPRRTYYDWRQCGERMRHGEPNPRFDARCELFVTRVDAASSKAIGLVQRQLHAVASGSSSGTEADEVTNLLRAGTAYIETRAAQERATIESKRARAAIKQSRATTAKTDVERALIEKFGRTAANIRRDAEEHTATAMLDAIREHVDEATYERIVSAIAGVAGRESASDEAADAAPVRGDLGRGDEVPQDPEAPREGEESSG